MKIKSKPNQQQPTTNNNSKHIAYVQRDYFYFIHTYIRAYVCTYVCTFKVHAEIIITSVFNRVGLKAWSTEEKIPAMVYNQILQKLIGKPIKT